MFENLQKVNNNSCWAPHTERACSEAMQVLSHFSNHNPKGEILLCNLQGGVYPFKWWLKRILSPHAILRSHSHLAHSFNPRLSSLAGWLHSMLSHSVIMSQAQDYEPTNLRHDGITSCFHRHLCRHFCWTHWFKPAIVGRAMRQGTVPPWHCLPPCHRTWSSKTLGICYRVRVISLWKKTLGAIQLVNGMTLRGREVVTKDEKLVVKDLRAKSRENFGFAV